MFIYCTRPVSQSNRTKFLDLLPDPSPHSSTHDALKMTDKKHTPVLPEEGPGD